MMDDLSREQILAAGRRPPRRVESTILGGAVYLRYLTSGERDRFLASLWTGTNGDRKRNTIEGDARLVSMLWVTRGGEPVGLTEAEVVAMDGEAVSALAEVAVDMNGLSNKAVETTKGNS